jgi:putative transposase
MAWWRLHYHVVWATRRRTPWLSGDAAHLVEAAIRTKVRQLGGHPHGVGVMPDHVHLATSLPPSVALDAAVGQIKGYSSWLLGQRRPDLVAKGFEWQGSFGIVSVSEVSLPKVIAYVANQEAHHRDGTLLAGLERSEASPTTREGENDPLH